MRFCWGLGVPFKGVCFLGAGSSNFGGRSSHFRVFGCLGVPVSLGVLQGLGLEGLPRAWVLELHGFLGLVWKFGIFWVLG